MNSIRRFFINELEANKEKQAKLETPADEEAEFQRCLALNEQWNLEIAKNRDVRVNEMNEKRREQILKNLEGRVARAETLEQKIEEKVRKQKDASSSFITQDHVDKAIENALASPVSFNFSIDLQGVKSTDKKEAEEEPK
jgi:small subunit ribosomal protein S26